MAASGGSIDTGSVGLHALRCGNQRDWCVFIRTSLTCLIQNNITFDPQTRLVSLTNQRIGDVVPLGDDPQLVVFQISLKSSKVRFNRNIKYVSDAKPATERRDRNTSGSRHKAKYSSSGFAWPVFTSHASRTNRPGRSQRAPDLLTVCFLTTRMLLLHSSQLNDCYCTVRFFDMVTSLIINKASKSTR